MAVSTWSAYHRTSKMSKEIFNLYKKACEVGLKWEGIPEECLHLLVNYAIAHGSTNPMVLSAALPLASSLLGLGTGIRLLAYHLGFCKLIYPQRMCRCWWKNCDSSVCNQ